ncbi:MAG TPA: hypothetical protein PKG48_02930 [Bacteroidales bacterium]|nr:hypothetical protein [Bacteroidales bacterium]HPS62799.1 hypothetical protein [Bacteroidales bacterium]
MKKTLACLAIFTLFSTLSVYSQHYNQFLDAYSYHTSMVNLNTKNANEYYDIEGSPYYNGGFNDAVVYLKDSSVVKMPLRYNIYGNKMEYKVNGINYEIANPVAIDHIELGGALFIYVPGIQSGTYAEVLRSGNCQLVQKRAVRFEPSEGPKPVVGTITPARFSPDPDTYYMIIKGGKPEKIYNIKSVLGALTDQKAAVEEFIKKEKIRRASRDNLLRIADFYNSL